MECYQKKQFSKYIYKLREINKNKMSMNKNQNLNKINQILLYSQNYVAHKKMLNQIKPCVNSVSPSRNNYNKRLISQHDRYAHAVERLKIEQLDQSNKKFSQKLVEISKPLSKQKVIEQNLKSLTSRSFWNLKTAKQRQRNKQQKFISMENKKMSQRVSQSRSKQSFGRQSYYKQKAQTMRDLNVRGQFSQRSQSVLENLICNDLKINSRDIPFLPLLSQKQKVVNPKMVTKQKSSLSKKKSFKTSFQRENLSFQKQMNFRL